MNYYISMELGSSTSQSESVEKKELTQENKKPEFVIIVIGGICSGKTTLQKEKYSNGYVNIDTGEIFIELSQGEYFDFPSHLEEGINRLGVAIINVKRMWL